MASSLEQLALMLSSFGPVGTGLALAAVPVVAGAAVYITRMGTQAQIDRLAGEIDQIKKKAADDLTNAERKYTELDGRYQGILRSGALIQGLIEAIVAEAAEIAVRLDASDYAVLVPAPTAIPGDVPEQLVFLCASGPQSSTLLSVRVPISSSLSGEVYSSGKTTIASPSSSAGFANRTDKITGFKTNQTLSVCLRHRNGRVGVAQFLNKRSGQFDYDDAERAPALCATLAIRVGDFAADPRRMIEMGHAPRRNQYRITSMFVDLTNYSNLFRHLDSSVIADLLNQYFQALCTIAINNGATIDQFIGDGVLLLFNVDQRQDAHEAAALASATQMRAAFRDLRQRWVTLGYSGTETLFVRFGLSCGSVTRTELGYSQTRRVTVIGPAVNAAAYACESAPRDRDAICLTKEMREAVAADAKLETASIKSKDAAIFELCG
jgi:class 3 adenylate cyclase